MSRDSTGCVRRSGRFLRAERPASDADHCWIGALCTITQRAAPDSAGVAWSRHQGRRVCPRSARVCDGCGGDGGPGGWWFGVRIKLLDSLRLGVPTVTTGDGASGLPLRDDREVLLSDDREGFAARLVKLCDDPELRLRLREAGLCFLRAHHSQVRAQSGLRMALGLPIVAG